MTEARHCEEQRFVIDGGQDQSLISSDRRRSSAVTSRQPGGGEIHVGGKVRRLPSPRQVIRSGSGTVHQELLLFLALSVAGNIIL
jgi:hypothetical protein